MHALFLVANSSTARAKFVLGGHSRGMVEDDDDVQGGECELEAMGKEWW